MADNIIKTRIKLLYKSLSEWQSLSSFIPLKGELCVSTYQDVNGKDCYAVKVGDGIHRVEELDWASANAIDIYNWAKKDTLDWEDLDATFKLKLIDFIEGTHSLDTIYRIVPDGANRWVLQKDDGEGWEPATGEIDINEVVDRITVVEAGLDTEAGVRESNDEVLRGAIQIEAVARLEADDNLLALLNDEKINRADADANLRTEVEAEIEAEILARADADGQLLSNIDLVSSNLANEVANREAAIDELALALANEAGIREEADTELLSKLDAEALARETKDLELVAVDTTMRADFEAEKAHLEQADQLIILLVETEALARLEADTLLQSNITAESNARIAADNELTANITSVNSRLLNEIANRESADSILQLHIDLEALARLLADSILTTSLEQEKTDRSYAEATIVLNYLVADLLLGSRIDSEATLRDSADRVLLSNIEAEESARISADNNLALAILNEASARNTAVSAESVERIRKDNDLLTQIDVITQKRDVVDVVAVYDRDAYPDPKPSSDLLHYDTKDLAMNDIIKVLHDESNNGAIGYWRWTGAAWDYVGKIGPFYTISETDALIDAEATIRLAKDAELETAINLEKDERTNADIILTLAVETERSERESADSALQANIDAHVIKTDNPHAVTKQQVGLGNVDNKSESTIKADFTGTIESGNTGFAVAGDVFNKLQTKQDILTAGANITITDNVIAAADMTYDDTEVKSLISANTAAINTASANLEAEVSRSVSKDSSLESAIVTESQTRSAADAELLAAIAAESTQRAEADSVLTNELAAENTRATAAESSLQIQINSEITNRTDADTVLDTKIGQNTTAITALNNLLVAETERAEYAEDSLNTRITNEINRAIATESDVLAAVETEASTRTIQDNIIEGKIDSHSANTTVHITAAEREAWSAKQDALVAGENIDITGNVISAIIPEATINYEDLNNKPKINNIELLGNKTLADIGAVEKTIIGTNGKALIFNESDGGGAKFEHSDGTESFVGVNNGGESGIAAQIYADKLISGKWQGAKLDVYNDGIYYTVGSDSAADRKVAANEVATKKDIPVVPTAISAFTNDAGYLVAADIEEKADKSELSAAAFSGDYDDLINTPVISDYSIVKDENPGEFAAVYHLTKDGTNIGVPINIVEDILLSAASIEIVTEDDEPYPGARVGDKYILLAFKIDESTNNGEPGLIIIPVKDLTQVYTAGAGIDISADDVISVTSIAQSQVVGLVEALDEKAGISDLSSVAFSGSYNDLTDKPEIPTKVSELINDTGYITDSYHDSTKAEASDLATHTGNTAIHVTTLEKATWNAKSDFSGNYNDLTNKPSIPEKVSDLENDAGYVTGVIIDGLASEVYVDNAVAEVAATIPTKVSELTNDSGYITSAYHDNTKANKSDLAAVATSGSYTDLLNKPQIPTVPTNVSAFTNDAGYLTEHLDISGKLDKLTAGANIIISGNVISAEATTNYSDLSNKPKINNVELNGNKSLEDLGIIIPVVPTNVSAFTNDAGYLTEHQSLDGYALVDETGNKIILSIDPSTFVLTASLLDKNNITLNNSQVDLPLETMVVSGRYDATTKKVILELKSGQTIEFSIADLISGLVSDTTFNLHANDTNIHVTAEKLAAWDAKSDFSGDYNDLTNKPVIPSLDGYATETFVNNKLLTKLDVIDSTNKLDYSLIANTPEIPVVPANVSAFTNDAGYLTEHQSLLGYATELWTLDKLADKQDLLIAGENITIVDNVISASGGSHGTTDYTQLENKPKINGITLTGNKTAADLGINVPTKVSDLTNDSLYLTYSEVNSIVSTAVAPKLDKLIAGDNITITGNVISATASGGTGDYSDLTHKPSINNVELTGNKSLLDLGIDLDSKADKTTVTNHINDSATHITNLERDTWNAKVDSDDLAAVAFTGSYNELTDKPEIPSIEGLATEAYVDNLVETKLDKITSANKLDYSLIANTPEIPTVPTNVSAFTNDAGYLTEHQDISGKQDKLIAGTNITIVDNVISAIGGGGSAVTTEPITTTVAVGNLAAGATYPVGTPLFTILKDILVGGQPVGEASYYIGISDDIPTSVSGLTKIVADKATLLENGISKKFTTDNLYVTIAVDKSLGIELDEMRVSGFAIGYDVVETADLYIYYEGTRSTISSTKYEFTFMEV